MRSPLHPYPARRRLQREYAMIILGGPYVAVKRESSPMSVHMEGQQLVRVKCEPVDYQLGSLDTQPVIKREPLSDILPNRHATPAQFDAVNDGDPSAVDYMAHSLVAAVSTEASELGTHPLDGLQGEGMDTQRSPSPIYYGGSNHPYIPSPELSELFSFILFNARLMLLQRLRGSRIPT
jgi:hypothetical protein